MMWDWMEQLVESLKGLPEMMYGEETTIEEKEFDLDDSPSPPKPLAPPNPRLPMYQPVNPTGKVMGARRREV